MMEIVRFKTGAPVAGDFASAKGALVVDTSTSTGRIYFLDDGGNVRECGDYLTAATIATLTVSTLLNLTGGQIKFPATAVPSADANTLDDYEEGTWTPADGSGAGLSLTVTQARYTKIGRMVHASCYVAYPATANASNAAISGLPFTVASHSVGVIVNSSGAALGGYVNAAGTTVSLRNLATAANVTNASLTTAGLIMSLSYSV